MAKEMWLITTGTGKTVRGRYWGTKDDAKVYCDRHYAPKGYKIKADPNPIDSKWWKSKYK